MENEEERRKALREFYSIYRRLQKKHTLRLHSHFSIYDDGLIEIWEYKGDQRTRAICKGERRKRNRVLQESDRSANKL